MSEYTTQEVLKLIEENNGPDELDLSGKDMSGIDLGREAIKALESTREGLRRRSGELDLVFISVSFLCLIASGIKTAVVSSRARV